jgi:hypothetical protein
MGYRGIKVFNQHLNVSLSGCYLGSCCWESPSPGSICAWRGLLVNEVKRVYNLLMTMFRYGRERFEEGEFVRRKDVVPGDGLDPVVRIVEDLGTIEIPCGKVDCRANCLEYLVRPVRARDDYALAECKISRLVSII